MTSATLDAAARFARARELEEQGAFEAALAAAREAAALLAPVAEAHPADRVQALVAVACIAAATGRLEEALEAADAALAHAHGPEDEPLLRARVDAGEARGLVLRLSGRYREALEAYDVALADSARAFGFADPGRAALLNGAGVVCKYGGWFTRGAACYRSAVALAAAHGDDDLLATLYHNLGGLEHARGRPRRALPFARASVCLRSALPESPGRRADRARDEGALAAILLCLPEEDGAPARLDEAEALLARAVAILTEAEGDDAPEVQVQRVNLAAAKLQRGLPEEAALMLEAALAAKERALGAGHPEVEKTRNNLGVALRASGRIEEARAAWTRARDALVLTVDADHPTLAAVRENLAGAL
jgi:tetratricopeptide (TPR) repeat protein